MDTLATGALASQFDSATLKNYQLDHAYDEMFAGAGALHEHYGLLLEHFQSLPQEEVQRRKQAADLSFLNQGITFTVYGREDGGKEHIFPYDLVPRIIRQLVVQVQANVLLYPIAIHTTSHFVRGHLAISI